MGALDHGTSGHVLHWARAYDGGVGPAIVRGMPSLRSLLAETA